MKKSYKESVANYFGPESCADARKGMGEAFDRGTHRLAIEPRKMSNPRRRRTMNMRKATFGVTLSRVTPESGAVEDPMHVRNFLIRESGDPAFVCREGGADRVGKSKDAHR
jgi:hypothetical protein